MAKEPAQNDTQRGKWFKNKESISELQHIFVAGGPEEEKMEEATKTFEDIMTE
jgi:hypothetical protein